MPPSFCLFLFPSCPCRARTDAELLCGASCFRTVLAGGFGRLFQIFLFVILSHIYFLNVAGESNMLYNIDINTQEYRQSNFMLFTNYDVFYERERE